MDMQVEQVHSCVRARLSYAHQDRRIDKLQSESDHRQTDRPTVEEHKQDRLCIQNM